MNTSTYPNNEHTLCQEQIKYLREENSSKNSIKKYYLKIKVLLVMFFYCTELLIFYGDHLLL